MTMRRALHFVFKVGDRQKTSTFYRDVLGMKFLRHEEFEEGCKASCNGPYDGKWSKSMVGYGPEDNHFVVELTYNYGLGSYKIGNDFQGIHIFNKAAVDNAKKANWPLEKVNDAYMVQAPDGYKFFLYEKEKDGDPVERVTLASSDLAKSAEYWKDKLGMKVYSQNDKSVVLGYCDSQCKLELVKVEDKVEHATAFGRIAFSCPREQLPGIQSKMEASSQTILTRLVSLDTPGKATVEVVILADPDGHEICFVGDEAFRELSQVDPKADDLLNDALSADKSHEWFAKKGLTKKSAE